MEFLQPHKANLTPHPAPVAPFADLSGREGCGGAGLKSSEMGSVLSLGMVTN